MRVLQVKRTGKYQLMKHLQATSIYCVINANIVFYKWDLHNCTKDPNKQLHAA